MKTIIFISLLVFSFEITAQSIVRDRHGNTYPTVRLKNGDLWLAKNLAIKESDSYCWNNKEDATCRTRNGRLYTYAAAEKACKNLGIGWQIPRWEDWDYLYRQYDPDFTGKNYDYDTKVYWTRMARFSALAVGGKSNLDLQFSGFLRISSKPPKISDFREGNVTGSYWCRSPLGSNSIIFKINRREKTFIEAHQKKTNAVSVRCVKN